MEILCHFSILIYYFYKEKYIENRNKICNVSKIEWFFIREAFYYKKQVVDH